MNLRQAVNTWWGNLAVRERRLVTAAAWLVGAALIWWVALAPAISTLSRADAQHLVLDAQLQRMLALQSQTAALRSQVVTGAEDARRLLEASLKPTFGADASVQFAGERATVNLRAVPSAALAGWLVDVRANARLLPAEVRLVRSAGADAVDRWDGSVVLNLPQR